MSTNNTDLIELLPTMLPKAIAWAEAQSQLILAQGAPLGDQDIEDARTVGVANPQAVRIAIVPRMPLPEDADLRTLALDTGLLGPETTGLTLGHGILILRGQESRPLFTHELRHVHQYEQAGSIAAFLRAYLEQISSVGYWDAPFERDARAHELQ
jgi:hypothetical protein